MKLINADKLESEMYHNAFEIDTDLQKWDSGCWIRYKMFENVIEEQPTVKAIPIEFIKRFADFFPPTPTYIDGEESIDMGAWCEELLEHWEKENETKID